MAIARGAGTEIIRSASFEHVSDTHENLIFGVRHHIYTVLSIIINAEYLSASPSFIIMSLKSYDANLGDPQQDHVIFKQSMATGETFVWNDKFSFNGYEPVDFTGPIDSEAKQDAIADQLVVGDSNRQVLDIFGESSDQFAIHVTFIDQNNS